MISGSAPHQLHRARAIGVFKRCLAWSLYQHVYGLPDAAAMIGKANGVLDRQQIIVAAFLDFLGYIVCEQLVGLGPRPRTVLEDKAVLEARFTDEVARALERFLGFAAESDDEIAADRHTGH